MSLGICLGGILALSILLIETTEVSAALESSSGVFCCFPGGADKFCCRVIPDGCDCGEQDATLRNVYWDASMIYTGMCDTLGTPLWSLRLIDSIVLLVLLGVVRPPTYLQRDIFVCNCYQPGR